MNKYKLKKIMQVSLSVLAVLVIVATFSYMSALYYTEQFGIFTNDYEEICYGIWCAIFAMFFYKKANRIYRIGKKIFCAVITSFLFTVLVFLANCFWKYIALNNMFFWKDPASYLDVMLWDITYTQGFAKFRYPVVFLIMLAVCSVKIILSLPKVKELYGRLIDRIDDRICEEIRELREEEIK